MAVHGEEQHLPETLLNIIGCENKCDIMLNYSSDSEGMIDYSPMTDGEEGVVVEVDITSNKVTQVFDDVTSSNAGKTVDATRRCDTKASSVTTDKASIIKYDEQWVSGNNAGNSIHIEYDEAINKGITSIHQWNVIKELFNAEMVESSAVSGTIWQLETDEECQHSSVKMDSRGGLVTSSKHNKMSKKDGALFVNRTSDSDGCRNKPRVAVVLPIHRHNEHHRKRKREQEEEKQHATAEEINKSFHNMKSSGKFMDTNGDTPCQNLVTKDEMNNSSDVFYPTTKQTSGGVQTNEKHVKEYVVTDIDGQIEQDTIIDVNDIPNVDQFWSDLQLEPNMLPAEFTTENELQTVPKESMTEYDLRLETNTVSKESKTDNYLHLETITLLTESRKDLQLETNTVPLESVTGHDLQLQPNIVLKESTTGIDGQLEPTTTAVEFTTETINTVAPDKEDEVPLKIQKQNNCESSTNDSPPKPKRLKRNKYSRCTADQITLHVLENGYSRLHSSYWDRMNTVSVVNHAVKYNVNQTTNSQAMFPRQRQLYNQISGSNGVGTQPFQLANNASNVYSQRVFADTCTYNRNTHRQPNTTEPNGSSGFADHITSGQRTFVSHNPDGRNAFVNPGNWNVRQSHNDYTQQPQYQCESNNLNCLPHRATRQYPQTNVQQYNVPSPSNGFTYSPSLSYESNGHLSYVMKSKYTNMVGKRAFPLTTLLD